MSLRDAARKGDLNATERLLAGGKDPDEQDKNGYTPLSWAAKLGHLDVIKCLMAHGARVDIVDAYGETAMNRATRNGHTAVVEWLLRCGVDPNGRHATPGRHTPQAHLPERAATLYDAAANGHIEVCKRLIAEGASLEQEDVYGHTLLQKAIRKRSLRAVQILVAVGADIEHANTDGERPMHVAARRGDPQILSFLLEQGAMVETLDSKGRTPMWRAVHSKRSSSVELLARYGAKHVEYHPPKLFEVSIDFEKLANVDPVDEGTAEDEDREPET